MLTHYSPLRGWLPSVTLGHKDNQTTLCRCSGSRHDIKCWCFSGWAGWGKFRVPHVSKESYMIVCLSLKLVTTRIQWSTVTVVAGMWIGIILVWDHSLGRYQIVTVHISPGEGGVFVLVWQRCILHRMKGGGWCHQQTKLRDPDPEKKNSIFYPIPSPIQCFVVWEWWEKYVGMMVQPGITSSLDRSPPHPPPDIPVLLIILLTFVSVCGSRGGGDITQWFAENWLHRTCKFPDSGWSIWCCVGSCSLEDFCSEVAHVVTSLFRLCHRNVKKRCFSCSPRVGVLCICPLTLSLSYRVGSVYQQEGGGGGGGERVLVLTERDLTKGGVGGWFLKRCLRFRHSRGVVDL
jgi:hypothetical protein